MLSTTRPQNVEEVLVSMATTLRKLRKGELAFSKNVFPAKTEMHLQNAAAQFERMVQQYRLIGDSVQQDAAPWLTAWLAAQDLRISGPLRYEMTIPGIGATLLIEGELAGALVFDRLTPSWPAIALTVASPVCRVTARGAAPITASLKEVLAMPLIASSVWSYSITTAVRLQNTEPGEEEKGLVLLPIKQRERDDLARGLHVLRDLSIAAH